MRFFGLMKKIGGSLRNDRSSLAFRECLDDCGLKDLGYNGDVFTRCNRRCLGNQILKILDRFVTNLSFHDFVVNTGVYHLDWFDHRAIELNISFDHCTGGRKNWSRNFTFEEIWLAHDDCKI